jgi:hypothetical protein
VHVRRHSVAVGVKWIRDDSEIIIGRVIPPVGQTTSTQMFVVSGKNLNLPLTIDNFDGATTLGAAKAFIERVFGIGDFIENDPNNTINSGHRRATVRHITPYLFVTKEVIYSESVLLHGLEKADKAKDIVATMPYFLGVVDEASAMDERRLQQLQRTLDREEANERSRSVAESERKQRTISLLTEAHRLGITPQPLQDVPEETLLTQLKMVSHTQLEANSYPIEGEFGSLHSRRREILAALATARRRLRAAQIAIQDVSGFEGTVARQQEKLMLAEHIYRQGVAEVCPLCESPSERGQKTVKALQATLMKVRAESTAIEQVKPKLLQHDQTLEKEVERLNAELRLVDDQIRTWLRQSEETRRLADISQMQAHLLGRISFFLETSMNEPLQLSRDLSVLRDEIAELEARVNREAKEIKLRRAENKISQFASQAFAALPTVAPCIGSELNFSSKQPEVTIIEDKSGTVLRMTDVGSDQNYLAVHIALAFALQNYFETVQAPVPGLLVFDQISRPYFPSKGEEQDEKEIRGENEDEDVQAMRRHIDFLFSETERQVGLQVLLIEHAYFADDPRYVAATRQRWSRASGEALIPLDWPMRKN